VKEMAKFLSLWRISPSAPWPRDPAESEKLNEMIWAAIDSWLKTGEMLEFGFFLDGASGYAIGTGESKDEFRRAMSFWPFIEMEEYETIPYDTGREVMEELMKAQAEQVAAIKW
jgi:hypothetical protein